MRRRFDVADYMALALIIFMIVSLTFLLSEVVTADSSKVYRLCTVVDHLGVKHENLRHNGDFYVDESGRHLVFYGSHYVVHN